MYDALNFPGCPNKMRGALDPNIDEDRLEMLYAELAQILLQLSKSDLPKIGSLRQVDDFSWEVASGPLSMNMNELVRLGTLPGQDFHLYIRHLRRHLHTLKPWHSSTFITCSVNETMPYSLQMIAVGSSWQDGCS